MQEHHGPRSWQTSPLKIVYITNIIWNNRKLCHKYEISLGGGIIFMKPSLKCVRIRFPPKTVQVPPTSVQVVKEDPKTIVCLKVVSSQNCIYLHVFLRHPVLLGCDKTGMLNTTLLLFKWFLILFHASTH